MDQWLRLEKKWYREMYSIHNEGKFVDAERCIRTWKNKIYKYMTSLSKMHILINKMIYLINIIINIIAQLKWNLLM